MEPRSGPHTAREIVSMARMENCSHGYRHHPITPMAQQRPSKPQRHFSGALTERAMLDSPSKASNTCLTPI